MDKKNTAYRGELLDTAKAAKRSGMSTRWLYLQMTNGTLPFPYFMPSPGKRLFDSADIDDWLKKIKVQPGKFPGEK